MEAGQHKKHEEKKTDTVGPTENERYHWDTKLRVFLFLYGEPYSPIQQDSPFNPTRLQLASRVLNTHPTFHCTLKLRVSVCREILKAPPTFRHKDTMDIIGLAPVVFTIRHRMSQHYDVTALFHLSVHGRLVPVLYLHTRNPLRPYRERRERY